MTPPISAATYAEAPARPRVLHIAATPLPVQSGAARAGFRAIYTSESARRALNIAVAVTAAIGTGLVFAVPNGHFLAIFARSTRSIWYCGSRSLRWK